MSTCVMCKTELTWENKTLCVKCGAEICDKCSQENQFKCDKCADKKNLKIPEIIRRSSIEDYKACPYYFKLHVIDGNEPRQHVLARLGSDLHDLYEHIQRGDIEISDIHSDIEYLYEFDIKTQKLKVFKIHFTETGNEKSLYILDDIYT